jgi:hypothetical protein
MSYSEITSGNTVSAQEKVSKIEEINVGIATVQSVCDKVTTDIGSGSVDPALVAVLTLLNDAIVGIKNNQKKLFQPQVIQTTLSHRKNPGRKFPLRTTLTLPPKVEKYTTTTSRS